MTENIMVMRLVNSDYIIATIKNYDKDYAHLINPAMIMMMTDQTTQLPKVAMGDYLIFSDKKEIKIDLVHIMFMHDPTPDLLENYNRLFNASLIQMPNVHSVLPFSRR